MADEAENDDQWLYGDAPDVPTGDSEKSPCEETLLESPTEDEPQVTKEAELREENLTKANTDTPPPENAEPPEVQVEEQEGEDDGNLPAPEFEDNGEDKEEQNGDGSDKDDSEDDSDDDVNVVIGNIKTSQAYTSLNIKRGGLLTSTVSDKSKVPQQQSGKFTVEEFEQMGTINWVPASDYNLDTLEDKPWRKPGADITDYFNYGFNEDTWKAYCERQKRLRVNESGVGLVPLNSIGLPRGPVPIMNDNSKYSAGFTGIRKAGPPPGRRMTGAIDVIGGAAQLGSKMDTPKENVIQVMTADRREYSRKPPGFPDLSMPPPSTFEEFQPEFGFNPEPEPFYGGYEPTQDIQWAGSTSVPAPVPPFNLAPPIIAPPISSPPVRMSSRDRDRDRESRSRSEKSRDKERERSHRRERSKSRSRRHKSRSRSPSHRHRKKKSRRHDDSD